MDSKSKKADFVSELRPQTPNLEMVSRYRIPRTREMELCKVYFGDTKWVGRWGQESPAFEQQVGSVRVRLDAYRALP